MNHKDATQETIKELSIEGLQNVLGLHGVDDRDTLERMAISAIDEDEIDEIEFILELGGE